MKHINEIQATYDDLLNFNNAWIVSEDDLYVDLDLLLDDIFIANKICTDNGIILNFKNGQTFIIEIKQKG